MNLLKRMSYKTIINKLKELGFNDIYDITKNECDLEGFTSGLQGFNYISDEDYQLVLRKYKNGWYVIEVETSNDCLAQFTKEYFNKYSNIDYIMINGGSEN